MKTRERNEIILLVALLVVLAASILVSVNTTIYEDGSARVFGHSVCLQDYCGGFGDPELLQSHDLPGGYFVVGTYQDYREGGTVTCYHDFEVCIFSGE